MECYGTGLLDHLKRDDYRYLIPVYQRRYSWKEENCRQLLADLKKIMNSGPPNTHFFGTLVVQSNEAGLVKEEVVIDGQQRITTVSLILLAIANLFDNKKISSSTPFLSWQIKSNYLCTSPSNDEYKLCPVEEDRIAFGKLFGDEKDYDQLSQLTINYQFFYKTILDGSISPDDIYYALKQLKTIIITLTQDEQPQLIFESLNSTGLALTEGDKIRNYILMNLPIEKQTKYYKEYWAKIEKCVDDVSLFIRNYLRLKLKKSPSDDKLYRVFRDYFESRLKSNTCLLEDFLKELLSYARNYQKLLIGSCGFISNSAKAIDNSLTRFKHLKVNVVRPFLMEVLLLHDRHEISDGDLLKILSITESFLFRRYICNLPSNSLKNIFASLNDDIIRYDGTTNNYVDKMSCVLMSKEAKSRFPNDEEFKEALAKKQIYLDKNRPYKYYLFERYENFGTKETKDVVGHLLTKDYSIEHIMPQTLSPAWKNELGENAATIHHLWVHRLANLTITAYNSKLSNKTFHEKRDDPEGGYKNSGIRMNVRIASKDSWGLSQLEERNEEMIALALKIWYYPETEYQKTTKKLFDSYTLDESQIDLTGREIIKYSYEGIEHVVSRWIDMFEQIIKMCHQMDRSILIGIAHSKDNKELSKYVSTNKKELRTSFKIEEGLFFERNTSTNTKRSILLRLFKHYDLDPNDLTFYLKPQLKATEL